VSLPSTTPPGRQVPGLIGLSLVAAYFLLCMSMALKDEYPPFLEAHPYVLWLGNWQMFTVLDRRHVILEAEALAEGQWETVDLEALFPTRWESGPRFGRPSFPEKKSRMYILAQSTCRRMEAAGQAPAQVRFRQVRWLKRPGESDQSRRDPERRNLITWTCSDEFPLPTGVRL
jgi:hypothetical protein